MDICPAHRKQYSFFCQSCESLLCLKCLDSHGRLGHVILSSEGAAEIFSEKLAEFHRQLKDKKVLIATRIQVLRMTEAKFVRSSESFETFSDQILSVFQRIEEILAELKTSIFTKYIQQFGQRSATNQIQQLRKTSTQIENELAQIQSAKKETSNRMQQFESVPAAEQRVTALNEEAALHLAASGSDGEWQRGSRARPTAATVALDVLQTLRATRRSPRRAAVATATGTSLSTDRRGRTACRRSPLSFISRCFYDFLFI